MSKRGNVTAFVLLAVVVVGSIALYVLLNPTTTANMVLPTPKEYGGAIRGVAAPGTKAFPAGRAIDLPDKECFTCSCKSQGITAGEKSIAESVCRDNCGGTIVSSVPGPCSS